MIVNANPQDSLGTKVNKPQSNRLTTSQTQYFKLLQSSLASFQKPYQHRTSNQLGLINKLVQKINFFKALQIFASTQTMRSVLKYGRIVRVSENKVVHEAGSSLDCFVLGLAGRFGIVGQSDVPIIKDQESYTEYFEQLKQFSPRFLQFLKKKQQRQPRAFKPTKINPNQFQLNSELTASLDFQLPFIQASTFNSFNELKTAPFTLLTQSSQCYIFQIDFKKLCEIMRQQYNKTLLKQIEIFTGFGCFRLFKKEKLRQMVQEMQLKRYKKGDKVFTQGDQDHRMFMLTKGQIQLQRMATLGSQNPNNLYKNRLSLKRSSRSTRTKDKINAIPFADFSKLYNASTQLKKVNLTRLSPISIFGEEQIMAQTPRQTTATVISLTAEIYVFTLDELNKYFTADSQFKTEDFLRVLSGEITEKKMLYRQEKLGGQVEWLSKSLKGGFYMQQNDMQGKKIGRTSGRLMGIARMNRTIPVKLQVVKTIDDEDQENKMFLTATFNCHNFEQFYESQVPKSSSKKSPALTYVTQSQHPQPPKRTPLSSQQKQILKLLHGNQRTIIKSANTSRAKSSRTPFAIDLDKPLFTPEYFKQQLERSRKIDKEMKKSRLNSLYQSSQGFGSTSKSRTLSGSGIKAKGNVTLNEFKRNSSYQI